MSISFSDQAFKRRATLIKLIIFDVDGVFTDGRIFMDDAGKETKSFHVLDGQGIKLLQQTSLQIAIISGRNAPGVAHRMTQLGIQHVYQGHPYKIPIYEKLLADLQLSEQEVAHVGDDLPDLPILNRVGLPLTVPNAVAEVLQVVPWVTQKKGGEGAVREICEAMMKAQGTWETTIHNYVRPTSHQT